MKDNIFVLTGYIPEHYDYNTRNLLEFFGKQYSTETRKEKFALIPETSRHQPYIVDREYFFLKHILLVNDDLLWERLRKYLYKS